MKGARGAAGSGGTTGSAKQQKEAVGKKVTFSSENFHMIFHAERGAGRGPGKINFVLWNSSSPVVDDELKVNYYQAGRTPLLSTVTGHW